MFQRKLLYNPFSRIVSYYLEHETPEGDREERRKAMKVTVDIMELTNLLLEKVSGAKKKEAAKAYMDCHDFVFDYLCKLYKEQTGFDPNDLTNMFMGIDLLREPSDEE